MYVVNLKPSNRLRQIICLVSFIYNSDGTINWFRTIQMRPHDVQFCAIHIKSSLNTIKAMQMHLILIPKYA